MLGALEMYNKSQPIIYSAPVCLCEERHKLGDDVFSDSLALNEVYKEKLFDFHATDRIHAIWMQIYTEKYVSC